MNLKMTIGKIKTTIGEWKIISKKDKKIVKPIIIVDALRSSWSAEDFYLIHGKIFNKAKISIVKLTKKKSIDGISWKYQ